MGADLAVEKNTTPLQDSMLGALAPVLTEELLPGLPGAGALAETAVETASQGIPWYAYLFGGALAAGGMYAVWRLVHDSVQTALPMVLPFALGPEMGGAMALDRLAQLYGGAGPGAYARGPGAPYGGTAPTPFARGSGAPYGEAYGEAPPMRRRSAPVRSAWRPAPPVQEELPFEDTYGETEYAPVPPAPQTLASYGQTRRAGR